jgi:hypothetical protein
MKKHIVVLAIIAFCLPFLKVFANTDPIIQVNCTHYVMHIKNNFPHTLKISVEKGSEVLMKPKIFSTGKLDSLSGKFTSNKLQNTRIICRYDEQTFSIDKEANDLVYANSLKDLRDRYDAVLVASLEDFGIRVAAKVASGTKTYSDDNMIISFFKWITRNSGKVIVMAYEVKDEFKAISNGKYNDLTSFLKALKDNKEDEKTIKAISAIIDRNNAFVDEKTKEYAIKAALIYLQEIKEINSNYQEAQVYFDKEHKRVEAKITVLKDTRYTQIHNAYMVAQKPMNLQTRTPNFTLSLEPLVKGGALNEFWKPTPDRLFVDADGDNTLEWSDGLWNKSFGGSFGFAVSPEMNLGKGVDAKLYAMVGYHQFSYTLDTAYKLSRNFFATTSTNSRIFNVSEPLKFEQHNISAGLACRFFLQKRFILDLKGGYIKQSGILNLTQSELSTGYTWANPKIKIVEDTYIPFGGIKLGYGLNNFHGGAQFCVGVDFYKAQQSNNTTYKITETKTDKPIGFGSDKLNYRLNIGITMSF